MRRRAFTAAGVRQAQNLTQGIGQQRILSRIAGQLVVRGIHDQHALEVQQAGFQHAEHLQTGERLSLKGHAFLLQHLAGDAVQHARRKGRPRQACFAQNRFSVPHQTVHGFRVQRKMTPHLSAVVQQKVADVAQAAGHVRCGPRGGHGVHHD